MSDKAKMLVLGITIGAVVIAIFFTLKGKEPRDATVTTSQPRVPEQLLKMDARERELLALVQKEPNNRDLLFSLGSFYFENSRFQEAIDTYLKILAINDSDVETLTDLGLALHYTGSSDKGIQYLRKATTLRPDHQRAWLSLGFVTGVSGRTTEAVPALKRAIELGPESPMGKEANRILGLLQQGAGKAGTSAK